MKKKILTIILSILSVYSMAYAEGNEGYLVDSNHQVVKNGYNMCWRTGSWTPANANKECDSELVKEESIVQEVKQEDLIVEPQINVIKAPITEQIDLTVNFDFNKANLTDSELQKIQNLVGKIMKYNVEVITVVGYSDRFGTEKYNLKLSEDRANIVKAELESLGLDSKLIYIDAQGKNHPIVECKGVKNSKTIKCLSPNRRAEIEVISSHE